MEYIYSFEKLEVWQMSKNISREIYRLTSGFPVEERYGLANQMRRAAISVSSNIAEGSSRLTGKSKGQFYSIAFSSLTELYNQLIIADELGFFELSDELKTRIKKLSNFLNKLHKSTTTP